jgi:hypothetical protein
LYGEKNSLLEVPWIKSMHAGENFKSPIASTHGVESIGVCVCPLFLVQVLELRGIKKEILMTYWRL